MKNFETQIPLHRFEGTPAGYAADALSHFALDDALLREVNHTDASPAIHYWPIEKTVILGMMDTKLPFLTDAITFLQEEGYTVRVRPSGGLAVVADAGILNFSYLFADTNEQKISIQEGYERMVQLVRAAFSDFDQSIEAYEISDSYCPGTYDLSINGKKFAGIAQRRFKNGIGVMIYFSVTGNQTARGELLRTFYEKGLKKTETKWNFPQVNPASMANLSDLLETAFTVEMVTERLDRALRELGYELLSPEECTDREQELADARNRIVERNARYGLTDE